MASMSEGNHPEMDDISMCAENILLIIDPRLAVASG
jgi:hypothetical protein